MPGSSTVLSPWRKRAGELAPGRRIADADGVADPAVLDDAVARDDPAPSRLEVLAGGAGLRLREDGFEPLHDDRGRVEHLLGRLAEVDAARQGRVVAVPDAPLLDVKHLAGFSGASVQLRVRGGGELAHHRVGRLARKGAADPLGAADRHLV